MNEIKILIQHPESVGNMNLDIFNTMYSKRISLTQTSMIQQQQIHEFV